MKYVYHRVPENMIGTVLYPLNKLPGIDNDIYEKYKAGYEGREQLLERKIPYLNCLWNDVLHCSPVHPQEIIDALKKAEVKEILKQEYFEISVETDIDIKNAVIFYRTTNKFGDIYFEKAAEADWGKVDIVPQITLNHYRDVAKKNEPLFAFHGIPHFLYKGSIETKDLEKIKVS